MPSLSFGVLVDDCVLMCIGSWQLRSMPILVYARLKHVTKQGRIISKTLTNDSELYRIADLSRKIQLFEEVSGYRLEKWSPDPLFWRFV